MVSLFAFRSFYLIGISFLIYAHFFRNTTRAWKKGLVYSGGLSVVTKNWLRYSTSWTIPLSEERKPFVFSFYVCPLTGEELSDPHPSQMSPMSIRSWQLWNLLSEPIFLKSGLMFYLCWQIYVYRVSQEEWTKLRESVPYVKVYRYNPKHLWPKFNGYGDNGQRSLKVWQLLHTYWLPNSY